MTQTKDLIKRMADFFKSEEYYEKGEDARLEFSPDDVRCVNRLIQRMSNLDKIKVEINKIELSGIVDKHTMFVRTAEQVKNIALDIIDKYRNEKARVQRVQAAH